MCLIDRVARRKIPAALALTETIQKFLDYFVESVSQKASAASTVFLTVGDPRSPFAVRARLGSTMYKWKEKAKGKVEGLLLVAV